MINIPYVFLLRQIPDHQELNSESHDLPTKESLLNYTHLIPPKSSLITLFISQQPGRNCMDKFVEKQSIDKIIKLHCVSPTPQNNDSKSSEMLWIYSIEDHILHTHRK